MNFLSKDWTKILLKDAELFMVDFLYPKSLESFCNLKVIKKALLIATNLTSICCVYKEKIDKDVTYQRA